MTWKIKLDSTFCPYRKIYVDGVGMAQMCTNIEDDESQHECNQDECPAKAVDCECEEKWNQ